MKVELQFQLKDELKSINFLIGKKDYFKFCHWNTEWNWTDEVRINLKMQLNEYIKYELLCMKPT